MRLAPLSAAVVMAALAGTAGAASVTNATFVNGLQLDGSATDLSTGTAAERRLGYFSDLYYDPQRKPVFLNSPLHGRKTACFALVSR